MRKAIVVLALILSWQAEAKLKDYANVATMTAGYLGSWSVGDGDQVWNSVHCVASSNYSNKYDNPPPLKDPAAVHMPYRLKVRDRKVPAGYYFYLDDDSNNTGNARIEVTFEHRDFTAGTTFEQLGDDVFDSHSHEGQFKTCKDGNNSELQMTISDTELSRARAGTYYGSFQVQVIGGSSGTKTNAKRIEFTIDVSESVRIDSIENITLGEWGGTGGMDGNTTFCIYSNNLAASYNVTISSTQQDGGNFRLGNAGLSEYVAYTLEFADSVGGAGTVVTAAAISGNGDNSASDCGGVDNAQLSASILEVDLGAATPDAYSDTVTILVAPE